MIGPIRRKVSDLDVAAFRNDPSVLEIDDNDADLLMNECKADQLDKLKGSKNACKGAILAEYVLSAVSPPALCSINMLMDNCNHALWHTFKRWQAVTQSTASYDCR